MTWTIKITSNLQVLHSSLSGKRQHLNLNNTPDNDQVLLVDLVMQVEAGLGKGFWRKARAGLIKQTVRTRHPVDRQLMETRPPKQFTPNPGQYISDFPAAIGRAVEEEMN
jgi:hypothetical protein